MQIKKLFLNEINLSSNRVHRRNSRTFLKKVFGTFPSAILLPIEKFHATVTATWNKKMKSRMILRNSVSQCPLQLRCLSVCLSPWRHLHLSPPYDVLDHTDHIFSESLSSGYDNESVKDDSV